MGKRWKQCRRKETPKRQGLPKKRIPPVENLVTEEPGGEAEQKPSAEDEGAGTIGETDGQPDEAAAPQKVMRTAGVAAQADGDVSGDGWVLDADGTLTIESDAGMSDWVSFIKTDNFWDVVGCVTIVNILPDVTNIGEAAFGDCFELTTITIPASVERIGAEALASCDSLDRVIMQGSTPPTLGTYENKGAHFEGCGFVTDNLKGIKVPEGTTAVYKEAWPEWAAYITDGSASEVEIIDSGTGWTFDSNGKLTIESDEGLAAWKKDGYSANKKKIRTVELLERVTKIVFNSFGECSRLAAITIPSSVTEIERYTFPGDALTNITIPAGVTRIGESAFMDCRGLESVTVLGEDPATIGSGIFQGCKFVTDDVKGQGIKVPAGTAEAYKTAWPDWADYITDGTEDLLAFGTDWTLDKDGKLTIKSDDGMTDWTSLGLGNHHPHVQIVKTAEIQDGVTSIQQSGFWYFSSLEEITIPNSVKEIGNFAFVSCSSLASITIPDGVTSIGERAFNHCSSLTSITIPNSVTSIGEEAFRECSGLTSINLSNQVTSIGKLVFAECKALTSITIPDGMTSIGESMFDQCSSLESITIPDSVTSIGDWAFYKCSALTDITIPDSVTSIGVQAFGDCSGLTSIVLPPQVTSIAPGLFMGCSNLEKITLPDGVTSIGEEAFGHCSALTSITLPNSVTDIGMMYTFAFCSSLTSITIPDNVTEIGLGTFYGCSNLENITIPSNVTDIGCIAFSECSSLESVTMQGSTPPTLGIMDEDTGETGVFASCKFVTDNAQGIKVPVGSVDAYKTAWPEWADYITEDSASTGDKEKVEAAKKAVEDALAGTHVSNATTQESLEDDLKTAIKTALEEAGIDSKDVTITVENFTKTEATTDTTGNISANVKITSGAESAVVPVDQTINKLPGTSADKVAAVKTAVEDAVKKAIDEALAGTKVTNDNAEEIAAQIAGLIPDAVAGALEAAGVGADEIAIGEVDIAIEPATADSEGSIKVTIPVTSTEDAGQSGSAVIQVPVTKPSGEEVTDKEAEEAKKAVERALQNITITNETTPEDIRAALQEAFGDDATVEGIEELDKVDATQDAPGKLTLKIKVIINGKTIYVTVENVPIAQLSRKTGVYVRFTDYYDIDGTTPRYKYTGLAVKPAVEVYHNETLLTLGKDYTIGYKNNIKAGSAAALTVKGKGSFSGTSEAVNFTIINADIDQDTDHPTEMTVVVNTKVAPVIMNGTKKLTTKDYILEGDGLKNGKHASATAEGTPNILTVKGINNYAGSSFTINVTVVEKKAAGKLAVKVDKNFKPVYDGNALNLSTLFKQTLDGEGAITVTDSKDKTKFLKEGTDFTVVCTSSLVNAGTVKFTLTGMGAYTGSVSKTFKISPLKVTDRDRFAVTFDENKAYEYKAAGAAVDDLVVKYLGETDSDTDDKILIPGVDYKVTYSNHKKVSTKKDASLKITFLGNYKGSSAVSRTFKVVTAKLSARNTVVTVPDKVYSKANRAYKSTPIVTVDGVTIKASSYTVSYAWATGSEAEDDAKYIADNKVKITIADGDTWAKVKVTVTPKETGSYGLAEGAVLEGAYYVRRIDSATNLSKAKMTFYNKAGTRLKTLEYNGSTFYTPTGNNAEADDAPDDPNAVYVRVTVGGAVVDPGLYDVTWTNATAKGKATVVIRGKGTATDKGMAVGSKNQAITIKAMGLKGKTLKSYVENAVSSLKNIFSLIQ